MVSYTAFLQDMGNNTRLSSSFTSQLSRFVLNITSILYEEEQASMIFHD